jgi:hypothetical protein
LARQKIDSYLRKSFLFQLIQLANPLLQELPLRFLLGERQKSGSKPESGLRFFGFTLEMAVTPSFPSEVRRPDPRFILLNRPEMFSLKVLVCAAFASKLDLGQGKTENSREKAQKTQKFRSAFCVFCVSSRPNVSQSRTTTYC